VSNPPELGTRAKAILALALTAVGGFVDAVGYIALFLIYTANMSGNSVHVGMYLGQRNWAEAVRFVCAIASYFVGLLATRVAIEIAGRAGHKRIASFTLGVEAALLAIFAHATPVMHFGRMQDLHSAAHFALIALLAFAMGVQTATLTRVGALTIYTTFVTGTLTKLTESLTRFVFWMHDELRQSGTSHIVRQAVTQRDARESAMLAATWSCYVLGAAMGTILKARWELRALYLPVAVLAGFIVVDRLWPIAVQEEQEQTRSSG
jgi:uncharacterized membrane protein YoaK (UPF0700 family)